MAFAGSLRRLQVPFFNLSGVQFPRGLSYTTVRCCSSKGVLKCGIYSIGGRNDYKFLHVTTFSIRSVQTHGSPSALCVWFAEAATRTGDSRGFAFVRYKYADEAEKAIERLDGRNVDGRDIVVQFAKYGPNAEVIHKGRLTAEPPHLRGRYRSRSPRRPRSHYDDYRDRDYRRRSRSRDSYGRYKYHEREREYRRRSHSRSRSASPTFSRSRSHSRIISNDKHKKRSRSLSLDSGSPVHRSPSPHTRSPTSQPRSPNGSSPSLVRSPVAASLSPSARSQSSKPGSVSPSNSG